MKTWPLLIISVFVLHSSLFSQTTESINLTYYLQSISTLMPTEFVSSQRSSIQNQRIIEAEQAYLSYELNTNSSDTQNTAATLFAFAFFHYYILEHTDYACSMARLALGYQQATKELPRAYALDLRDQCFDTRPVTSGLLSSNHFLRDEVCDRLALYCKETTYTQIQRQALASQAYQEELAETQDAINLLNEKINFEYERYRNLHKDLDEIFYQITMDQMIPREIFWIEVRRSENQIGLNVVLRANINHDLSESERTSLLQKIFVSFTNAIRQYENRFKIDLCNRSTDVIIAANNRDLGIAADNVLIFEAMGIPKGSIDITLPTSTFDSGSAAYSVTLDVPNLFRDYAHDMRKRIDLLNAEIEALRNE